MATDEARASTNETLFGCDVKTTYTTRHRVRQAFFLFFRAIEEKPAVFSGVPGVFTKKTGADHSAPVWFRIWA
jgi:hypothetical protein